MKFFGTGSVWDAKNNKILVEFINGIVETDDPRICTILKDSGFKYEGKMQAELDEKTKQLNELKTQVETLKKGSDPKAIENFEKKINEYEIKIKELENQLAENKRSAEVIRDKIVELGLANKKEVKDMPLIDLCEIFISKLQSDEK